MKKRLFGIMLSLVMVMTMIPFASVTVSADTPTKVYVSDFSQLKNALETSDNAAVYLTKDIKYETTGSITPYGSDNDYANINKSMIGLINVKGVKNLILDGHSITVKNKTDGWGSLFCVKSGSKLFVQDDSGNKAVVKYEADVSDDGEWNVRNLFSVEAQAELGISGGTYKGGWQSSGYLHWGLQHWVVKQTFANCVYSKGIVRIYDGDFEGRGCFYSAPYGAVFLDSFDAKAYIYGGNYKGSGCAKCLSGYHGEYYVYEGKFETDNLNWDQINNKKHYAFPKSPCGLTTGKIDKSSTYTGNEDKIANATKAAVTANKNIAATKLSMPNAKVSEKYDSMLAVEGPVLRYKLTSGKLPQGLTFNEDGSIKGTPGYGTEGTYSFTVAAVSPYELQYSKTFTFKMNVEKQTMYDLAIDKPVTGNNPDMTVSSSKSIVNAVNWYEGQNDSGKEIVKTDKFEGGKVYTVKLSLPSSEYSHYNLTVNGQPAKEGHYGDADNYIFYTFPATEKVDTPDDPGTDPEETPYVFPFKDVHETDWFYGDVYNANKMGLIDGKGGIVNGKATLYLPNDNMTYAEAIKLAACMNQIYNDGKVTLTNGSPQWYQSYVDYAKSHNIPWNYPNYNAQISRADYVHIFYAALPKSNYKAINSISGVPDMTSSQNYYNEILTFYKAGILTGDSNGNKFLPNNNIKRSEVAAILSRMMDSNARKSFSI